MQSKKKKAFDKIEHLFKLKKNCREIEVERKISLMEGIYKNTYFNLILNDEIFYAYLLRLMSGQGCLSLPLQH